MWGLECFLLLPVSHTAHNCFPLSVWLYSLKSTKQRLREVHGKYTCLLFQKSAPFLICKDNRELPSMVRAIPIRLVIQAHSPNPAPLTSSSWMFSSHLSVSRATPTLEYQWTLRPTAAVVTMSPTSLHPLTSPSLGFRATDMGVNIVLVHSNARENSWRGDALKARVCGFLRKQWESCSAQFYSVGRYESEICGEPFWHDRSGEQDVTRRWGEDGG